MARSLVIKENYCSLSAAQSRIRPILSQKHPEQDRRLNTLDSYDILDSSEEADFDEIVALASAICDVPVSLISLVDDDRQWFKARTGFAPEQTTLDQSICSHAILETEFLEISDLAKDPRTADNPLHVADPKVNFYAGANLVAPNGMPIGTLCVLDTKPRKLTTFQRDALKTLSRQVMTQLELRKKLKIEEALRSEIDHRVKNSLQTIASILRLAARQVKDPDALGVLELIERRLDAVATLHTELMSQDGAGYVDAQPYVQRLGELLSDVSPENVGIVIKADAGVINAKKASTLGMIVSEFVANSIKHAFPGGQDGRVTVTLQKTDAKTWSLECRDDGVGPTEDNGPSNKNTGLGEMLMASATMQLGGQSESGAGPDGTFLKLSFKAD